MDEAKMEELLRLHERGCGLRAIAARLRMSRKTVRAVLSEAGRLPPSTEPVPVPGQVPKQETGSKPKQETGSKPKQETGSKPKRETGSKLDPFREVIQDLAQKGCGSPRILREILPLGYRGGRTILVQYLREIRPRKESRARRRFETPPAEEVQADWSPYRLQIAKRTVTVHAFATVLAFSRFLHIRFYRDERLPTLLYAIEEALRAQGGVARRMVFDNMTTVTLGRASGKPIFHERFLEFSRHYMFEPVVCRPYDPDRKGKVERPFHYLEHDFLPARSFASLAELNAEVQRWLREVANVRVHGTTRRVPLEVWETEERPLLIALPERPFGSYRQEVRQVQIDGLLSFDGVRYSAPAHLAGTQVTVRATPDALEVLDALGNRVAVHAISEAPGAMIIDPSHQPPRSRASRVELEDELLRRFPSSAEFMAGLRKRQVSFAHLHLRKLRILATRFPEGDLLDAIRRATELRSFSAHTVARLLDNSAREVEQPPAPLNAQATLDVLEEDDDPATLEQYRELEAGDEDHAA